MNDLGLQAQATIQRKITNGLSKLRFFRQVIERAVYYPTTPQ